MHESLLQYRQGLITASEALLQVLGDDKASLRLLVSTDDRTVDTIVNGTIEEQEASILLERISKMSEFNNDHVSDNAAVVDNTPAEIVVNASKYRVAADQLDAVYARSVNPTPVIRLQVPTADNPNYYNEIIRGFDICLVHVPNMPHVGCSEKVKSRGLCETHLGQLRSQVSKELTTWDQCEAAHLSIPGKNTKTKRSDFIDIKTWLLPVTVAQ